MQRIYEINQSVSVLNLSKGELLERYFEATQMLASWSTCEIEREEVVRTLATYGVKPGVDLDEDLLLLAGALHAAWKTQGK